ncbi:MAG: Ig-like domain-containing protein [Bacteroidales bacterium]|nr:Ig-like domain-containing protein [Bacteroidales bacterium]
MKKVFSIAFTFVLLVACIKREDVKPEIKIPAESAQIFSSGISFDASASSATVKFSATDAWTAEATDTKASSWLSIQPSSGKAGEVSMTLSAPANPSTEDRTTKVSIVCGTARKEFTVKQSGIEVIAVTSVTLDQTSLTLEEEQTATLAATVKPDDATDKTVTWSSSDATVAKVDEAGKVTAVKEGTATITAKAGEKSATCEVTVKKKVIEVESVTLDKAELTLVKGSSETLTATVAPENATDKTVTWSTSDAEVATVDETGKVTAVEGGTALITVKAGEQADTCKVTVTVPVENIALDQTSLTLEEEKTATLTATVTPENATDKTVTWSTSDAVVATVDETGKVTAVKEGTATITAKAGEKSATCEVTVKKKFIAVESVTLNKAEITLVKGSSETLSATVAPENATDKTVSWSTSDAAIATVDETGKVTAVEGGTATITAKAGEKTATCKVTVTVPVETVTLDQTTLSLEEEQTATLVATVKPDNATDKTVTWSSSDAAIAKVDETGKVTAIKEGTATITAKSGEQSATCSVTVKKKVIAVESITLDKAELSLNKGETATLKATVTPDNATDKKVTWSSSDTAIASVDENGKVTALKGGKATITAKAGEKTATCVVSVNVSLEAMKLNLPSAQLLVNGSLQLEVIATPEDATYKSVKWESSDRLVAKVSDSGEVTGVSEGKATITATIGTLSAKCEITVIPLGMGENEGIGDGGSMDTSNQNNQ